MPPVGFDHNTISANVGGVLHYLLKHTPRQALGPNQQLRYGLGERYGYADAIVFCGKPEFDPADPSGCTMTNPVVVVEVLSPPTAEYDRGIKREWYQELPSLRHYLVVEQACPAVTLWSRMADGDWSETEIVGLDAAIPLDAIGVELPMAEVYLRIKF